MVFKMDVLVFFKYGFTVLVQFNTQTICRFNGGDFYMVGLDTVSYTHLSGGSSSPKRDVRGL